MGEETREEITGQPLLGVDTVIRPRRWCHGCERGAHLCPPEGLTGSVDGDATTQS